MRTLLPIFVLALCASVPASGQAIRFDSTATTTSAQCVSGKQCPLLVLPGTQVNFCQGTPSTLSACLASPATTYKDASAGVACATTAQLTPGTGGSCIATADAQGGYGAWFLPGSYGYYLRVPVTAGGGTYGPYALSIHGDSGGYTLDSLYSTLAQACTAAGTGTLAVTRVWSATPSQTLACSLWFLGDGKIQTATSAAVVFGGGFSCLPTQQCLDSTTNSGGSFSWAKKPMLMYPQWWGVKSDGTDTTSGATLTAAIHAASQVSSVAVPTLSFPPGTYKWVVEVAATGYLQLDFGAPNSVTLQTTGITTALNHTGPQLTFRGGPVWRQTDTLATRFIYTKNTGGGLILQLTNTTFVSQSASAVNAVEAEDVNAGLSYIRDNLWAGPCYDPVSGCGADSPGATTTRTAIGLKLTAPASGQTTALPIEGNSFQGWKHGLYVIGGYLIQVTRANVFRNDWIGILGVGGAAGSFNWLLDGVWCEGNKYVFSGSSGNGCGFFGDPADPTNNTAAVAPRLVRITPNSEQNTAYDLFGGPSIKQKSKYKDPSLGTVEFDTIDEFSDGAHASWQDIRNVSSTLPFRNDSCDFSDASGSCEIIHKTINVPLGTTGKIPETFITKDSAGATWYHRVRHQGAFTYIETVNDPDTPSAWDLTHFPVSSDPSEDTTVGANVVVKGDHVSTNANGTTRIGSGVAGVVGGGAGTTTNHNFTLIRNSVTIARLVAAGFQVLVGDYISADGSVGHTGATCSAYKNGICTAP